VSFVLTEALTLKKIKLLDVVLEGVSSATKDEGGFDADVALFTGELRLLIPALIEALGGVQERVAAAAPPAPPADAAADEAAPWDTVPA
jgi:recombination associated protein RdgC